MLLKMHVRDWKGTIRDMDRKARPGRDGNGRVGWAMLSRNRIWGYRKRHARQAHLNSTFRDSGARTLVVRQWTAAIICFQDHLHFCGVWSQLMADEMFQQGRAYVNSSQPQGASMRGDAEPLFGTPRSSNAYRLSKQGDGPQRPRPVSRVSIRVGSLKSTPGTPRALHRGTPGDFKAAIAD